MDKHKASYTNIPKSIIVQVLLSVVVLSSCNEFHTSPNVVDSQPALPSIELQTYTPTLAYGQEEREDATDKVTSASRKRKRLVSFGEDTAEQDILVKKINQEPYFGQHQEGFAKLPIELQVYILSFLEKKDFHKASLVCHDWRNAACIVGKEKVLDLTGKKLNEKDCEVLLQVPFSLLVLSNCQLGIQEILILSQSRKEVNALANGNLSALISLNLGENKISAAGAEALAGGNLSALTYLDLYNNYIGDAGANAFARGNLTALTSLNLGYNNIENSGAEALANGNLTILTFPNLGKSEQLDCP